MSEANLIFSSDTTPENISISGDYLTVEAHANPEVEGIRVYSESEDITVMENAGQVLIESATRSGQAPVTINFFGISVGSSARKNRVRIETGEGVNAEITTDAGRITCTGTWKNVRARTDAGSVRIDRAVDVDVNADAGAVTIGTVLTARIKVDAGNLQIDSLGGDATLEADAGNIRVGAARRGTLRARTDAGSIQVGIPFGTAVNANCKTELGQVRSELPPSQHDDAPERFLNLDARTSLGSIKIMRAQ